MSRLIIAVSFAFGLLLGISACELPTDAGASSPYDDIDTSKPGDAYAEALCQKYADCNGEFGGGEPKEYADNDECLDAQATTGQSCDNEDEDKTEDCVRAIEDEPCGAQVPGACRNLETDCGF